MELPPRLLAVRLYGLTTTAQNHLYNLLDALRNAPDIPDHMTRDVLTAIDRLYHIAGSFRPVRSDVVDDSDEESEEDD